MVSADNLKYHLSQILYISHVDCSWLVDHPYWFGVTKSKVNIRGTYASFDISCWFRIDPTYWIVSKKLQRKQYNNFVKKCAFISWLVGQICFNIIAFLEFFCTKKLRGISACKYYQALNYLDKGNVKSVYVIHLLLVTQSYNLSELF